MNRNIISSNVREYANRIPDLESLYWLKRRDIIKNNTIKVKFTIIHSDEEKAVLLIDDLFVGSVFIRFTRNINVGNVVVAPSKNTNRRKVKILKLNDDRVIFYINDQRFNTILKEIDLIREAYFRKNKKVGYPSLPDGWFKDTELVKLLWKIVEYPIIKKHLTNHPLIDIR